MLSSPIWQTFLRTYSCCERVYRTIQQGVRETCLGAYAHQGIPCTQLLQALFPEQTQAITSTVQVMFQLKHLDGIGIQETEEASSELSRDMSLEIIDTPLRI